LRGGSPVGVRPDAALRSNLCIVVPVRGERSGKSRLRSVLDPVQRARLNRALLRRTLAVIEHWQGTLARCLVVSACARSLRTASRRGACAVREPLPRRGLSSAAQLGARVARRQGARRVLILPCDLPLLSAMSLTELFAHARTGAHAVIAPDRSGSGTNALLLPAAIGVQLEYGPESFRRHLRILRARGWEVAVCAQPQLQFDLDTPEDLIRMPSAGVRRLRDGR
jgi:2-phospho-L-lactate/phosphoenolpyruvate guanylyltransferase